MKALVDYIIYNKVSVYFKKEKKNRHVFPNWLKIYIVKNTLKIQEILNSVPNIWVFAYL